MNSAVLATDTDVTSYFSDIIWGMMQMDYSAGLYAWEDLPSTLEAYSFFDGTGREIQISPKNPQNHTPFPVIENHPAFFYNLGYIVLNPDGSPSPSTSQDPRAIQHRSEGQVLTYGRSGYINTLNIPEAWQYPTDLTEVTIKYDNSGSNYSLTYSIRRNI